METLIGGYWDGYDAPNSCPAEGIGCVSVNEVALGRSGGFEETHAGLGCVLDGHGDLSRIGQATRLGGRDVWTGLFRHTNHVRGVSVVNDSHADLDSNGLAAPRHGFLPAPTY
jgi:hypothetical protein